MTFTAYRRAALEIGLDLANYSARLSGVSRTQIDLWELQVSKTLDQIPF